MLIPAMSVIDTTSPIDQLATSQLSWFLVSPAATCENPADPAKV